MQLDDGLDAVNKAVVDKITSRAIKGMATYGKPMTRTDVSTLAWLQHFQEELLDAAVYVERLIQDERNRVLDREINPEVYKP